MKRFRVIDFETTGFPPNAGVIEVGWTDLIWDDKQMFVDPATYSKFCDPKMPIDPGAKAVHHIQEHDLLGAPHPDKVLETLADGADFIVAHNLAFEEKFFTSPVDTICTLKCARHLIDAPSHANQYLRYFLDFDLDRERAEPAHRAGPDTYVTAVLLRHLLALSAKQYGSAFVTQLVKWTNEASLLTRINFGKYKGMTFREVGITDPGYLRWIVGNDKADPDVKHTAQHWLNNRGR